MMAPGRAWQLGQLVGLNKTLQNQEVIHLPSRRDFFFFLTVMMHGFNKWCWNNWVSKCKRIKVDLFCIPYTEPSSKCILDLNVGVKIIKLLGKKNRKQEIIVILD